MVNYDDHSDKLLNHKYLFPLFFICNYRSSMQLANRLDIQLRSVVAWQELFHPDSVSLRQRYLILNCALFVIWISVHLWTKGPIT